MPISERQRQELETVYQHLSMGTAITQASLPVPIWQFLCWAADHKPVVLHGSGDAHITEFEPRQSNDVSEFGNRKAVYAASEGIWPMFYAVVDRTNYSATINNAAVRYQSGEGQVSDPVYFFSISKPVLEQRPFRQGFVYLLPKDTFETEASYPFGSFDIVPHHCASLEPVRPLALIRVQPNDFPFLNAIRGHDDEVLGQRAERNPNGFPWVDEQEP